MTTVLPSLDILLRGGVCVLLLLVAALLLRDYGRNTAARLGALFAFGVATYAICSASGFHALLGGWAVPVLAISTGNNLVFWLFARALFDDAFRPRSWHFALWLVIVAVALVEGFAFLHNQAFVALMLRRLVLIQSLIFAVLAGAQTLATWRADLVERRRRLRLFIVLAAAGHIIVTALTGLIGSSPAPLAANTFEAGLLLAIAAVVAWSLMRVSGDDALFAPAQADPATRLLPNPEPLDRALVATLERAMTENRVYRQDGLTIGTLAHTLGLPEHKLRRLINQGLGYRNFNVFLNHYRIADTKVALADPAEAAVPILTIALDAGFTSLGPFNRAFKADTGMTPSEFRRARLGRDANSIRPPEIDEPSVLSASRISNSA